MSAEVGQQNTPVPGDNCDVTTIQDEDLLRKMWQTTDDFGRKKEIRARMYKLREARLREFYTTGEVLKDVQSVDPTAVSVSIREETPKRGGTHYRQLVVGELRGDVESSATVTTHYETTTTTGGTVTKQRTEEVKTLHNNGAEVIESSKSSSSSSRLPRLNVSTRCSETTQDNKMSSSSNDNRISTERQTSNTDTKIMSELQKLDTFLSTTGVDTPTPTPDSIRSSAFDGNNWTVVSTNTKSEEASKAIKDNNATVQEFVFESGEGDGPRSKTVIAEYHQPGSETAPEVHAVMKQTASHAQYSSEDGSSSVTRSSKTTSSYSVSHQQRRISSDNSLAHEAFARSLRSPERRMYDSNTSTRTSSKSSLDASIGRGSPERAASTRSPRPSVTEQRNVRSSPRSSPEKERSAPSSPTRFSRGSPTRANPDKARVSPTRDTVDKCSPVRSSPERKFSRESPEKISPTRETTERRVYQSSTSTTSTSRRRTSQTSPQRQSPTRETPQRKNSQPSSPKKEESERRVSQTRRPSTKDEPQRRNSQVKSESPARASPEKDRASSPEKSPSPTRFSTSSTTRLTSSSVSKRKLSSASSRASAKRAGTPGASPNASPTRADTRDDKTQESSSEDESQDEIFISGQQKQTSEVLNVSAEEDSTQVSEVLSHTLLTSAMNESLSTSMKTNSLSEISTTKTTDVEISGSNTLPRKKSSIKEPLSPQITPQTSPETVKKSPENEISGTGTLPRKKSSLKSPSTPQTTPQTTPQSSPESKSDRPTDFRSTLKNFEMRSSPVTTPDKPRSILRQDHSPKPSKSTPSPSEPDDSSRSLKSGTVDVLNVMSVVEQQLEMTPCEEVVESARAEPIVPVTPVTRKNTVQERTARRRSRDYVSDEDTSERDSSSSPIRKHPSRQQPAPKTVQKTPVSASPQRPTKLPVASNKHDTGINSPDRCCGRQHGDHDKPWRQSPASSPVSFKRKPLNSTASPVSSPERKPTTPQRRRPASRSPSTSPDRPHEATTRPGRKSPPQKSAQSSPRTPPGKHVTPAASPARRVESPAGKRQITERTSSGGRLRGPTDTQRTSNLAKPSARGPSSPTKVDSPVGRGVKSPTKGRPAVVDDGDESPPQEFRVEETSEDEVARKVCTTSRIATSTSRRADVVRKVQGSPTSPTKPGARTQPSRVPANTTSRVPRVEPVAQRPSSRVPTATSQPQKKLSDTAKPRPTRTDSDKSIGCKRSVTSTATVNKVTKTAAKTVEAQKTIGVRKQTNNVSQISSRFTSTNTTASKLQRPQATTSKKSGVPTLKVPAGKPVQNGHTPGPVESEDEVESTFSTEEDETVTELEEVRYSSHTVDDTEDEDFKTRVNTCGASLKVGTTDIVQLRSSRDSSPENRPQRFADHISEPESDFDTRKREPTPLEVVIKPEQITDLDEENEVEPSLLSVADRVSRFLTPGTLALLQSEKKKMQINETNKSATLDSPNAVRRARAMFETIANAPSEPVPKQTVPDILSRPSIFDSPTRGRSPVPVTSVKKNIQSFEQETVEQEHILVSESEEDKYKTKVTEDESKFNTYNKKQTDDDAKYNTYKKEPIVDEIQTKEPVKMDEAPRKTSVCDESITTESKFVSTATLTTSRKQSEEKPRAVVAPRQESPVRTKDGATKQKPTEQKPTSGGKFGVTLRKTPSTVRMESKTVEQTKTTSTTTTVIEGIVIEETTDIKLLEQMMEKATDYDERRRLRAQIREVRRLGPAAAATPARKASSPTRQVKPSESERRPSNTTRVPETSRQSPTRRSSSPTKPMNEEVTRKTSGAISPTRQEPTRKSSGATSPTRQEPTRKSSGATSPTRQEPTRKSSGATSPTHQEPTRKSSGATSPTRQEPTRKSSGATSPTRRAPKDEEDGNRMSSTFIRQASKKFEDEARKSSTSTIKKDESKFSTFTRQSSGKKVVTEDESRFNTFTRTSSSKKIESEEVPSTQRKSSKSEITIELAKPTTTTAAASTRKPSVPSVVPGVPREAETACSVTSSYGVGPTDENGRPLFGLRALRRSQQQEPGSVVLEQPASDKPDAAEVKDTSGRPLFGLRAIKREGSPRSSDPSPAREQSPAPRDEAPEEEVSPKSHTMPERAPSNGQLRDLVTKHEQRGSPDSGSSPPQKPRAKLRDSFITTPQQSRDSNALKSKEEALTSRTQRSSALRAIIQKHESITDSEQTSKSIRKDSVRTDKSQYSVTVDSAREASPSLDNDAERASPRPPTDEATRRPSSTAPPEQVKRGILKKPRDSPERSAINHTSTTTTAVSSATINLRRVDDASVNKIIEDSRKRSSASRSPPDGSTNSSFELESPRAVAEQLRSTSSVQLEKSRISPEHNFDEEKVIVDEDGGETRVRTTHREEVDGNSSKSFSSRTTVTQRTSPRGAEERFSTSTSTTVRTSSSRGSPRAESPSKDPAAHSMARVGRSGSVKALQQRFQQAAAGSTENKTRGYQKAGLIFRTNSFQHTNGCGPQGDKSKEGSPKRDDSFDSEGEGSPSTTRRISNSEGRTSVSMEVNLSGCTSSPSPTSKSFLGNETRVTGVQDILTRMREADNQEVVAGETEEDREARSLLNKFLGAQVLLQGMEPLVNAQSPGLVSQVERQRLVVSTSSTGKEELSTKSSVDDLENIWDEKQLKQLLDACEDYDTRRKIRARLRVVMAENKVTSGSEVREFESTPGGGEAVMSSVRGELLPFIVEQLKSSLERGTPAPGAAPHPGACGVGVNGGGVAGGPGASGTGSSISSDDGPAFDSGTESGEDPRTPSSQTEVLIDDNADSAELSCFMEGLKNSFESRNYYGGGEVAPRTDQVAELPPDVIGEVHAALAKLRGSLQIAAIRGEIVDTDRSEALMSLITRLQTSLQRQEDQPPPPPVPPPWQQAPLSPPNVVTPPVPAPRKKRQNRHTVGVCGEELVDARKHYDDHFSPASSPTSTAPSPGLPNMDHPTPSTRSAFRPVHFSPMRSPSHSSLFNSSAKPFTHHAAPNSKPIPPPRPFPPPLPKTSQPQTSVEREISPGTAEILNNDEPFEVYEPVKASTKPRQRAASWTDDPSHLLFTPAESVQIAIHKAAINKQISQEEENRKNEVKFTADSLVLDALDDTTIAVSKDDVIHHFPAPVVHSPAPKPVPAPVLPASMQPPPVVAPIQKVPTTPNNKQPSLFSPPTPTKVVAPVRPNLPMAVVTTTKVMENHDVLPQAAQRTKLPAVPQPTVKQVQATVQKVESLKQTSNDSKPSGKPLVSMLATSKPVTSHSEVKKPEIKVTPAALLKDKTPIKEPFESTPKSKISFNIVQEDIPVPQSVIWGSILNSVHTEKPHDDGDNMSSAQKLLQIASNRNDSLSDSSSRSSRSERRRKLKRANTIDIPKPLDMIDLEDSDEENSGDEGALRDLSPNPYRPAGKLDVPAPGPFIPKTENDRKFLAFLDRHSPVGEVKPAFVAQIRGGHPWTNRFSNLKTNFEHKAEDSTSAENVSKEVVIPKVEEVSLPARKFWSKADDSLAPKLQKTGPRLSKQSSSNLRKMFEEREAQQKQQVKKVVPSSKPAAPVEKKTESAVKPPWVASEPESSVVVGSLTVSSAAPAHTVVARRKLFSAPVSAPPAPVPMSKPPQPTKQVPKISESLQKLEELQKQQQEQYMQQKQQQMLYQQQKKQEQLEKKQRQQARQQQQQLLKQQQQQKQTIKQNEIRGPAPISKFSHAQNSAFRPPEKRSNSIPDAFIPPSLTSVNLVKNASKSAHHAPVIRQHSDEITNQELKRMLQNVSPPPSLSRQVSSDGGQDPVMLTAVSRVMAAPMCQQATVTNKVKRRETDFEPPRMSAAKNLSSMLQRFADNNDDDLDPELCVSPPERRGYNLVRSAHSTSDMHDLSFQERFSSHNRLSSSRSSSIGKYENALSPISFNNTIDNDNVITMRLEIPLIQNTTCPSPTQYYQAHFTNPPPPPIILSPPTQRRTSSFNTTSQQYNDVPRDLSPRDVPSFAPLRKCESWHQLAYTKQRPQSLALPPSVSPRRSPTNAKIHMFSKQFEAKMSLDSIEDKQKQVQAYLLQQDASVSNINAKKQKREIPAYNRQDTLRRYVNDEDLENVDEVFESLFKDSVKSKQKVNTARSIAPPPQQVAYSGFTSNVTSNNFQRRQQSWEESSGVRTWFAQSVTPPSPIVGKQSESTVITSADSSSRTEVQTKTSSFSSSVSTSSRVSKAALPSKLQMSPFAKFKQLDEKNSSPSPSSPKTPGGSTTPLFKFTDPGLTRSASNVKERLLYWCQVKTKEYKDLKIENFSTSWSDGMAFCALIHHFGPENFNYNILSPEKRRKNFELAFKVAEEKFDIAPLLDVDDMVMMKKPDWKCVFTYVQSIYRRFKDELD